MKFVYCIFFITILTQVFILYDESDYKSSSINDRMFIDNSVISVCIIELVFAHTHTNNIPRILSLLFASLTLKWSLKDGWREGGGAKGPG